MRSLTKTLIALAAALVAAQPATAALSDPTQPTTTPPGSFDPPIAWVTKCFGEMPTITGTSGNDVILGTAGNDVIVGLGGIDKIYGKGGYDLICGNSSHDSLYAGEFVNNDGTESGNPGYGGSKMDGGSGTDHLYGDRGQDSMAGGSGLDALYGGDNADSLVGGDDDDYLFGQAGNDYHDGGEGNDGVHSAYMDELADFNFVYGGPGDDKLRTKQGEPIDSGDAGTGNDGCLKDAGDSVTSCNYTLGS